MVLCVHVEKLKVTEGTAHSGAVVWTARSLKCTALGAQQKVNTCERSQT